MSRYVLTVFALLCAFMPIASAGSATILGLNAEKSSEFTPSDRDALMDALDGCVFVLHLFWACDKDGSKIEDWDVSKVTDMK